MRILWATDGSPASEAATPYLRGPLNQSTNRITVAAVAPAPLLTDAGPDPSLLLWHLVPAYRDRVSEAITALVVHAANLLAGLRAPVTTAIRLGSAPAELLALAAEEHTDLIVMGAHGHSAARHLLLGSVTRQVAVNARASVLVVRRRRRPRSVLLAYDGSPDAIAAVALLAGFVQSGMYATVLHVVEPPVASDGLAATFADLRARRRADARAITRAAARRLEAAGWTVASRVRQGPPTATLLAAIRDEAPDLVVLGARGTSSVSFSEHHTGTLAYRVFEEAPCSVLLARAPVRGAPPPVSLR